MFENAQWVNSVFEGATPTCSGLQKCYDILQKWVSEHPDSYPPVVIHYTDGECTEETFEQPKPLLAPLPIAESLRSLSTDFGNLLLFNAYLESSSSDNICLFPKNKRQLPEGLHQVLFEMSSEIPNPMRDWLEENGFEIDAGAKGMTVNSNFDFLQKGVPIGSEWQNLSWTAPPRPRLL